MTQHTDTNGLPPAPDWDELCKSQTEEWSEGVEYQATFDTVTKDRGYVHIALWVQGRTKHKQERVDYVIAHRNQKTLTTLRDHFTRSKDCQVILRDHGRPIGWIVAQIKFPNGEVIL